MPGGSVSVSLRQYLAVLIGAYRAIALRGLVSSDDDIVKYRGLIPFSKGCMNDMRGKETKKWTAAFGAWMRNVEHGSG